ncbi:MAG: glycosyl transferase, partial [Adhaeribacter sp.]|nr:glycosyl transferase [Adhaeribacter sp.]
MLLLNFNMLNAPLISVVSPVYKAEKLVEPLVARTKAALELITNNYEIILVDDCGPDNSWKEIKKQAQLDDRIKGIKLSRNFGQHYAITAGLDFSKGHWVVVMDCDLQDQPEEISKLYFKAKEGFDIVLARRHDRKDNFLKKLFSKLFYNSLGYLTGSKQDSTIANFGLYSRNVINAICTLRESIRYFPTMVKWVGFNSTAIDVEHAERTEGSSSYNFKRLINLALDIILAYSDKPLRITIKAGILISFLSFLAALLMLIRAIKGNIEVMGY